MCTSPHSDRSSRRGWPARHNVGSWTLMCSWKTSCLGWKRKGRSVFCCKQSHAEDTVCVWGRKKGKFSNKRRTRRTRRRATGQQHSPDGRQSDRIDYFMIRALCTYFILLLLFWKTKVKQSEQQEEFIFHKVPEINYQKRRVKQQSYWGSVMFLLCVTCYRWVFVKQAKSLNSCFIH